MLTKAGVVKIVDFGTCKDLNDASKNGPEFVGTPDYMSPEVVNNGAATPASDLWAFGCMLYQCAVGRTPFKVSAGLAVVAVAVAGSGCAFQCMIAGVICRARVFRSLLCLECLVSMLHLAVV